MSAPAGSVGAGRGDREGREPSSISWAEVSCHSVVAKRKEVALRKILCGIAVGTLTLASPGVAAAQIGGGGGLVDLNVQDLGVSAPITASGNQVTLVGDNSQTDSNNNRVASTAGRDNANQAGDTDDRDTSSTTNNDVHINGDDNNVDTRTTTVGGRENTVVSGDGNDVAESRGDILVDGDNNTVVRDRFNSDDVSIVNRDGTVAFASKDGKVTFTDRAGKPRVVPLETAVKLGVVPRSVLTHKHAVFPRNFVRPSGGKLAATGPSYGLMIMAALAMITAGYVVTRLTHQTVRNATVMGAPDPITLVVPDPDAVDAAPELSAQVPAERAPVAASVVRAAESALEAEIAKLRRQLAELASAPSGLALAGV